MQLCSYNSAQKCRFYEIEAIEIPIVYNKYGDHDPNGLLYVLKKDADRVQKAAWEKFCNDTAAACKRSTAAGNSGERRGRDKDTFYTFSETSIVYSCTGTAL